MILALVTVFLAATVAASVIAGMGRSIDSAAGLQDQGQARWLARGAADWARNVLADDMMRTPVDHLREPWAVKVPPTPVGEAEVAGEIQDWSGRFNVNNLAPAGKPDLNAAAQFARLLSAVDVSPSQAEQLAQRVQSWISARADAPAGATGSRTPAGWRPPHGPLADLGELRAIDGFDEGLLQRLKPLAVAVPAPSKININTAPAEVLFALTTGMDLSAASVLVAERERSWFRNVADLSARLPPGASVSASSNLDVRSRFFLVTGRARQGVAVVSMEVLLDRRETWPEIVWQRIL